MDQIELKSLNVTIDREMDLALRIKKDRELQQIAYVKMQRESEKKQRITNRDSRLQDYFASPE